MGTDDGDGHGGKEWRHQAQVTPRQHIDRLSRQQLALGRQGANGEKAAHHQEHLDGDAGIFAEPADEAGNQLLGGVGHGAVEGQVVQNDQLGSKRLEDVDEYQAGWSGGHGSLSRGSPSPRAMVARIPGCKLRLRERPGDNIRGPPSGKPRNCSKIKPL